MPTNNTGLPVNPTDPIYTNILIEIDEWQTIEGDPHGDQIVFWYDGVVRTQNGTAITVPSTDPVIMQVSARYFRLDSFMSVVRRSFYAAAQPTPATAPPATTTTAPSVPPDAIATLMKIVSGALLVVVAAVVALIISIIADRN